MSPRIDGGWLVVGPYTGADLAPCYIALGSRGPGQWRPAFKSWRGRERVLQVRPPAGSGQVKVWTKIDGVVALVGTVKLGG